MGILRLTYVDYTEV
jgi:hypothetical protein